MSDGLSLAETANGRYRRLLRPLLVGAVAVLLTLPPGAYSAVVEGAQPP